MANVNANYQEVLNTYFTNYFGPAATQMRSMFYAIVKRCNEFEDEKGIGRDIYDELEYTTGSWPWKKTNTYWTKSELNALVILCNEAKDAVDADARLTDAQKTAIKNRIPKESLFPRYVLCTVYENKSDRANFAANCRALGLTLYKESDGSLETLFDGWGV
jgi:hypothetical protein